MRFLSRGVPVVIHSIACFFIVAAITSVAQATNVSWSGTEGSDSMVLGLRWNLGTGYFYAGCKNGTWENLGSASSPGDDTILITGKDGADNIYFRRTNGNHTCGASTAYLYKIDQNGCPGEMWINGGLGSDAVYGSDCGDYLDTGDGSLNWAYGYGGSDTIDGGTGIDFLYGGSGNDDIWGGGNGDYLNGEGGTGDVLDGSTGDDCLVDSDGTTSCTCGDGTDNEEVIDYCSQCEGTTCG